MMPPEKMPERGEANSDGCAYFKVGLGILLVELVGTRTK
jgi:hypothetical protein